MCSWILIFCFNYVRLNLAVKQFVSSSTNAIDLYGNLDVLYSSIWCAKKRVAVYRQFQEKYTNSKNHQTMDLERERTTRWLSHSTSLNIVLKTYKSILDTLNYKSELIDYFTSLRSLLTEFTFQKIIILVFLNLWTNITNKRSWFDSCCSFDWKHKN